MAEFTFYTVAMSRGQIARWALHEAGEHEKIQGLLDEHTHRLINKVLHLPLSQLDKKKADGEKAPTSFYAAALRRLFDLEDVPSAGSPLPPPPDEASGDE